MDISIKKFGVEMDVKNKGVEFEVQTPNGGGHLGDLIVKKSGLEWCNGKIHAGNGEMISWDDFIAWANKRTARRKQK